MPITSSSYDRGIKALSELIIDTNIDLKNMYDVIDAVNITGVNQYNDLIESDILKVDKVYKNVESEINVIDNVRVNRIIQGGLVRPSDTNIRYSDTTEVSTTSLEPVEVKSYTFNHSTSGRVKISFNLKVDATTTAGYGEIYVDNIPIGISKSTTSTTYTTYNVYVDLNNNTKISLMLDTYAGGVVYNEGFVVLYDEYDYFNQDPSYYTKYPSNNIRNEFNTEVSTTSLTYVKKKTIKLNDVMRGTIRVFVELSSDNSASYVYGKIYINGSPTTLEFSTNELSYTMFNGDLNVGTLYPNDEIQLYMMVGSSLYAGWNMRFQLGYDNKDIITIPTTNI